MKGPGTALLAVFFSAGGAAAQQAYAVRARTAGKDWRTAMLQARFLRRNVRIRGWLQFQTP